MTRKRQILKCFAKSYLYEIAKEYEISGAYRMNAGDLVDALSRKRSVKIEEILNDLSLQDLKIACRGVGLDDKGRSKALLIDRLLGRDMKVKPKPEKKPTPALKPKPEKKPKPEPKSKTITKPKQSIRRENKRITNMTQKNNSIAELEKRLWNAADQLRANSALTAQEYSRPVLGLIFLKYANQRFAHVEKELANEATGRRRTIGKLDYQEKGVLYLPENARFSNLIKIPSYDLSSSDAF